MSKKRVHEIAKELGVTSKEVMAVLQQHNIPAKAAVSSVDEKGYEVVKAAFNKSSAPKQEAPKAEVKPVAKQEQAKPAQKQESHSASNDYRKHRNEQRHNHGQEQAPKAEAKGADKGHQGGHQGAKNNEHRHNDNRNKENHGHENRANNGDNRHNDNRNNDNRNNDRKNKKNKNKGGNRPQSLVASSMKKKKDRVKHRNEQYLQQKEEERRRAEAAIASEIELSGSLTVAELAEKMGRPASEIIKKLMLLGVMATINQEIDVETATIVAEDFGVTVTEVEPEADATEIEDIIDAPETLQPRPPVVTIMGHVDHGKTSLLDVIRKTNVTAGEAGGITQHIGAYQIRYEGNKITFLDTPGHEAFTSMRLRGAQSTDIAVLVVAADDGVMPQTIEAINHAKSAEVPIIVAINKMDKPGANPDHVKQQLAEHGLLPEEWGGDVIMVPVSAKQRQGIDDLIENILLVAEVMELKANPNRRAQGVVIEAQLDKGRGPVCTMLVQKGSLRIGDSVIAGTCYGKVRAMTNERGEKVKVARPSMPVEILGFNDVPQAGEIIDSVDDSQARSIAEKRVAKARVEELKNKSKVTLDDIFNQIQQGELKDLNIIIKADVQGSVEALRQSLEGIKNPEVRIVIVHAAVGAINESDVMLASASNAIIMGFNVRPDAAVRKAAEKEKVDLRTYRVIYDAINDVESAMRGMLTPEFKEVIQGRAEVRQVISTPKAIVAGSYVQEGIITNSSDVRLIRDGIVVFEGKVDSLRRFKDEVKEVKQSFECGISLEGYRDIKEGDIIEAFTMEEIAPKL
ncbi:MAG: translation initiation factor IF-2 [Veillonella sp.]|nr:translation initiation factor IF-2 [Veillonella sp.]